MRKLIILFTTLMMIALIPAAIAITVDRLEMNGAITGVWLDSWHWIRHEWTVWGRNGN